MGTDPVSGETIYVRKAFTLSSAPSDAVLTVEFDDDGNVYVNGTLAHSNFDGNASGFRTVPIANLLHAGSNVIAIQGVDYRGCQSIGLSASITSGGPPPPPIVVQLVHGYDGNKTEWTCGMEPLENYLKGLGSLNGRPLYTNCTIYRTREGVASGAYDLYQSIVRVMLVRQVTQVDVVAHSEGGLVARYCIQYVFGCKSTISLPHHDRHSQFGNKAGRRGLLQYRGSGRM